MLPFQVAHCGQHHGEGRHEVMGDVGEELQFLVVQEFNVLVLHVCHLDFAAALFAVPVIAQDHPCDARCRQEVERKGVPAQIPGCHDTYAQPLHLATPVAIVVGRPQEERVVARRQVGVVHLMDVDVGIVPFLVVALQHVGEAHVSGAVVVHR